MEGLVVPSLIAYKQRTRGWGWHLLRKRTARPWGHKITGRILPVVPSFGDQRPSLIVLWTCPFGPSPRRRAGTNTPPLGRAGGAAGGQAGARPDEAPCCVAIPPSSKRHVISEGLAPRWSRDPEGRACCRFGRFPSTSAGAGRVFLVWMCSGSTRARSRTSHAWPLRPSAFLPARSPARPPASFDVRLDGKSLPPRYSQPFTDCTNCADCVRNPHRGQGDFGGRDGLPPRSPAAVAVAAAAQRGSTPWASSSARNQIARRKSHRADCGSCKRHAMCHPRDPLFGVLWFGSVRHDTMGIVNLREGRSRHDFVSPCRCRQVARPGEPHRCGMWLASFLPGIGPPAAGQVLAGRSATTTISTTESWDGLSALQRLLLKRKHWILARLARQARQVHQIPRDIPKWQQHGGGWFHMAPVEELVVAPQWSDRRLAISIGYCVRPRLAGSSAQCLARILRFRCSMHAAKAVCSHTRPRSSRSGVGSQMTRALVAACPPHPG